MQLTRRGLFGLLMAIPFTNWMVPKAEQQFHIEASLTQMFNDYVKGSGKISNMTILMGSKAYDTYVGQLQSFTRWTDGPGPQVRAVAFKTARAYRTDASNWGVTMMREGSPPVSVGDIRTVKPRWRNAS